MVEAVTEQVKIEGEVAYPIYRLSAKWTQDGAHAGKSEYWTKGLPEGRIWNAVSGSYVMYREEADPQKLADEWGARVRNRQSEKCPGLADFTATGELCMYETWCLTWFCHWTFDDGRSNADYIESFNRYVYRHEWYQDFLGHYIDHPKDKPERAPEHLICLMGAEDRWRWRGENEDSPAPCRCKHCVEQGVVRINH